MSRVSRLRHALKAAVGKRDPGAAEGLFYEGSIEFEDGNVQKSRDMFFMATRLDPDFAGARYNLAVSIEKLEGASVAAIRAWEEYVAVAGRDRRQKAETVERVRGHIAALRRRAAGGDR